MIIQCLDKLGLQIASVPVRIILLYERNNIIIS